MEIEKELETVKYIEKIKLLEQSKIALMKYRLPKDTRPCISNLLLTQVAKGDYPDRKRVGLFIAVEMRRIGFNDSQIEVRLIGWNNDNRPPLPSSDIRGILKQSDKKNDKGSYKYSPGCNKDLKIHCVNKDLCFYYKQNFLSNKQKEEPDYIALKWQNYLRPGEFLLIITIIPLLEKRRGIKRGSKLFVSYKELKYLSGISMGMIGSYLRKLAKFGLIDFIPGQPRVWQKQASEINRIIPAPDNPENIKVAIKKKKKAIVMSKAKSKEKIVKK
ncbi:hypothetical protein ES708_22937 [subsurface metagenome]